jgi:hypothetical protein
MTDAPIDFRILAGAGAPVREFKAETVIFRQGDDAKELRHPTRQGRDPPLQSRARDTVCIFGERR